MSTSISAEEVRLSKTRKYPARLKKSFSDVDSLLVRYVEDVDVDRIKYADRHIEMINVEDIIVEDRTVYLSLYVGMHLKVKMDQPELDNKILDDDDREKFEQLEQQLIAACSEQIKREAQSRKELSPAASR